MPLTLRTTFRRNAATESIAAGTLHSTHFQLQFIPVEPISRAFRRALRNNEFDVCEMALITLAMAVDSGLDWVGLPIVLMGSHHHAALRTPETSPIKNAQDLPGHKIGVRAYSQTTGVWVRGVLQHEYGVSSDQLTWITTEDAHVAGFTDPPFVQRAAPGETLPDLLASGRISAAIGDGSTTFLNCRSVIPDPADAAAAWQKKSGVFPVNHILAFRKQLHAENPNLAGELFNLFNSARTADTLPYGRAAHERSVNIGLQYAHEQALTTRRLAYDDIFLL